MSPVVKFAVILAIILVLVGIFVVALRKLTGGKLVSSTAERNRSRQPRLGVVDVYDLDRARQLVLLRRDNVEHLLLLGGPNDVVIETNIVRVTGGKANLPSSDIQFDRPEHSLEAPARLATEPQIRPIVETGLPRNDQAAEHMPFAQGYIEPAFEQPVIQPQAPVIHAPSANVTPQQAAVAAASFAAVAAATQYGSHTEEGIEADVPDFLKGQRTSRQPQHEMVEPTAPLLAPTEPPVADLPPLTATPFPAPGYQIVPPIHQAVERSPFSFAEPEPAVFGSEPVFVQPEIAQPEMVPEPEFSGENAGFTATDKSADEYEHASPEAHYPYSSVEEETVVAAELSPEPEPVEPPAAETAPVEDHPLQLDEAILSDMARQLEEALKAANEAQAAEPAVDSAPDHSHVETEQPVLPPEEEETAVPSEEEHQAPAMDAAKQHISHSSDPADNGPISGDKPKPADDPFSLDDIEAEFARLLGRGDDKSGKP